MRFSDEFCKKFVKSSRVCVLTGAGISAESGVPTFRGSGKTTSVWKGLPFDQISSVKMIRKDLEEVCNWFDFRRTFLRKCDPNPAHFVLAGWEKRFEDFTLVTQNVDGLHARAGSEKLIEIHGNINRLRCMKCEKRFQIEAADESNQLTSCDECSKILRPDVVLFGEMLPDGAFEKAAFKAETCEVFFVIGTSALVYPAASLPVFAKQNGAYLVEVNPEPTSLTEVCDEFLQGKAGEILPQIEKTVWPGNPG